MNDSNRQEYEVDSQLWYFQERYRSGTDYTLRHDPAFMDWLEEKQSRDLLYQMRDTHECGER